MFVKKKVVSLMILLSAFTVVLLSACGHKTASYRETRETQDTTYSVQQNTTKETDYSSTTQSEDSIKVTQEIATSDEAGTQATTNSEEENTLESYFNEHQDYFYELYHAVGDTPIEVVGNELRIYADVQQLYDETIKNAKPELQQENSDFYTDDEVEKVVKAVFVNNLIKEIGDTESDMVELRDSMVNETGVNDLIVENFYVLNGNDDTLKENAESLLVVVIDKDNVVKWDDFGNMDGYYSQTE